MCTHIYIHALFIHIHTIYIHTYIQTYIDECMIYVYTCNNTHTQTYMYKCMHIYTFKHKYINVCIYIHSNIHIYKCMHTYTFKHTYINACIYIHTYKIQALLLPTRMYAAPDLWRPGIFFFGTRPMADTCKI